MKRGVILRLLLPVAAVGLPVLACQGARVESCSELGPEWTSCDGNDASVNVPNVCVLAKTKAKSCQVAAGSATTSPTNPGTIDGGTKCTAIAPDPCNGRCVDLKSDEANCGTCGVPCADTEFCANGECR